MSDKIPLEDIIKKSKEYSLSLKEIANFLSRIDLLETEDAPGWKYLSNRFFKEEINSLLDISDILCKELAPEAEGYLREARSTAIN